MSENPSTIRPDAREIMRLLSRVPVVQGACDLDLLKFLSRHPRTLLTMEQLAAFVGYEMKQVARSIDALIEAGLLERTHNPKHAARLYALVLDGPGNGGLRTLVELSSTPQGRREILDLLGPGGPSSAIETLQNRRKLHAIA
jgi:hypothetical protein